MFINTRLEAKNRKLFRYGIEINGNIVNNNDFEADAATGEESQTVRSGFPCAASQRPGAKAWASVGKFSGGTE